MMTNQVFAQALLLAGPVDPEQEQILHQLCAAVTASLQHRLREGIRPEDCKADFIAAASLYALAMLSGVDDRHGIMELKAADLTLKRKSGDAAVNCLQTQADLIISPYLRDRFAFMGV